MNSVWWWYTDDLVGFVQNWFYRTMTGLFPSRWTQFRRRAFLCTLPISGPLLLLAWVIIYLIHGIMIGLWVIGLILLMAVGFFLVWPIEELRKLW